MKTTFKKDDLRLTERQWMALDYAICVSACWAKDGKIYIEPLDPELAEIESLFEPLWLRQGNRKEAKFTGFAVEESASEAILQNFDKSPRAANRIRERLAQCYLFESKIPAALKMLTYELLLGKVTVPKPKAVKPSQHHRDTLLAGLAKVIREETRLPLASSAATLASGRNRPVTSSALAGAALASHGVQMNIELAAKIARENVALIPEKLLWGPVFLPANAPTFGNSLTASRIAMLDTSGKEHFRDSAIAWLMSHL